MKHLISLKTNQGIASVEDYQNGRIDRGDVIGRHPSNGGDRCGYIS